MLPINRRERKKAFMSFLLFFVITLGVIVTSIFFSFQVPLKENDKLRKEINANEEDKVFMQGFEIKMQETASFLDSVNQSANPYRLENQILNNMKDMTAQADEAPPFVKGICNLIIDNLSNLRMAKEQLRNFSKNTNDAEKKDDQIRELTNQLNICQQTLNQYTRPAK